MSSLLAGQRSTNWGHHLYHSNVDGDLSHDRHTLINTSVSGNLRFNILIREEAKGLTICRC